MPKKNIRKSTHGDCSHGIASSGCEQVKENWMRKWVSMKFKVISTLSIGRIWWDLSYLIKNRLVAAEERPVFHLFGSVGQRDGLANVEHFAGVSHIGVVSITFAWNKMRKVNR